MPALRKRKQARRQSHVFPVKSPFESCIFKCGIPSVWRGFAGMIARVCSEFVISDHIEDFLAKLRVEVLPAYTSADGILSVLVLRRALVGYNEVMVLSLWESKEAVFKFAGRRSVEAEFIKELGVIEKEIVNFDLVSTWSVPS